MLRAVWAECGRRGSAGVAGHEGLAQVVPVAARAHLDHVAGSPTLPGGELQALPQLEGPPVVPLEAVGEDIGEQAELVLAAYGARDRGLRAQVPGGPEELGVGVAD